MTRSFRVFIVLGAFIALGTSARAQTVAVQANIPFDFKVGHASLPSGRYEVRFDEATEPGVLYVRSQDGHRAALVLTEKAEPRDAQNASDRPKLVFEKDGEGQEYVLSEVFDSSDRFGLQVLGTHPAGGAVETRGD
jgi:hypothetical protein